MSDSGNIPSGWTASPVDAIPPVSQPQVPSGWNATAVDSIPGADAAVTQPSASAPNAPVSPFNQMGIQFIDALAAGAQGVSPVVRNAGGTYNYQLAPQAAQDFYGEFWRPQDENTQVALRDPATGQIRVWLRNPKMESGVLANLGRIITSTAVPEAFPVVGAAKAATPAQNLLQDFTRVGVTPNAPAVGQGIASGLAANIGSKLPIVGGAITSAAHRGVEDTAEAAERIAGSLGAAENPEQAGQVVQSGIENFAKGQPRPGMGPTEIIAQPTRNSSFSAKSSALYDRFWDSLDPTQQVPLTNTLDALKGPVERFPTAPPLGAQITSPRLQQFFGTLKPQTQNIPATLSTLVDEFGSPIVKQAAQNIQTGGSLTVPELKEFRSFIGRSLGDPMLINDIPRADLSNVYAAMSRDLEGAAKTAGPDAEKAFTQANGYYSAGKARIDQLEPLLAGSPEQAFAKINRAASDTGTANAGLLRSLQRSLPQDQWQNVGAAIIRRLGEPSPGAQDILHGGDFSPSAFATNWNKLSDSAKDTVFGANVSGSDREAIEALARVSQAQKNVSRFANPSGTASHLAGAGLIGIAAEHFLDLTSHPIPTILGVLGSYGSAKALMSPGFARWLYQMPKVVNEAPSTARGLSRALGQLDNLARANPNLSPVATVLHGYAGQPESSSQNGQSP